MIRLRTGLVLILAIIICGLSFTAGSIAEPIKALKKAPHQVRTTSHKKYHKAKHKKLRRVPAAKSMALLRQYLPELGDVDKTKPVQKDELIAVPLGFDFRSPFYSADVRWKLLGNIHRWLGTGYRYGGGSKRGIDCSGFTSVVITSAIGQSFSGSSYIQARKVERVEIDELQFGDLIFFTGRNRKSGRVGHVGIYIGNGVFAHSSSDRGVSYTHISEGYYSQRFLFGGRIISPSITSTSKPIVGKL